MRTRRRSLIIAAGFALAAAAGAGAGAPALSLLAGPRRLDRGGSLTLSVDAPAAGSWDIVAEYEILADRTLRPRVTLAANPDGADAATVVLSLDSRWADDSKRFSLDRYGNELLPEPVRLPGPVTGPLFENTRLAAFPATVSLHRGRNVIRLSDVEEPFLLGALELRPAGAPAPYAAYRAALADRSGDSAPALLVVEAESYAAKNDSFIRLASLADPSVSPYRTATRLLNAVDAGSWLTPGQSISWNVEVSEPGFYAIAARYSQRYRDGFPVFRTLEIDGEVPFAEAVDCPFPFTGRRWRTQVLSPADDAAPFEVWLDAGPHLLTLRIDAERLRAGIAALKGILAEVNDLGTSLKRLTGNQVDRNRTWVVDDYLPGVGPRLSAWAGDLDDLYARWAGLRGVSERTPGALVDLRIAADRLRALARDPDTLPDRLSELSEGQGSAAQLIGGLIQPLTDQPMDLDRIYLFRDSPLPPSDAGVPARAWEGVKRFALSFFSTSRAYQVTGAGRARQLDVWVNRPLPLVQVMQQLVDGAAARGALPPARFSVMPDERKLVLATASGAGPDLALGLSNYIPYDLALRGILADLAALPGFAPFVRENFLPESIVPYVVEDRVYGLTETQDFYVLFYRRDILAKFGLPVPDTWDDVIDLLPELQRSSMNFSIPMAGWTGLKPFYTTTPFLFQAGASLYSADGMRSALGSPEAIRGMELMTDLFTLYSIPQQVPSFYDSFRYGRLPLGIGNFSLYVQLTFAAPELAGLWDIAPAPGTRRPDGSVARTQVASDRADVIFRGERVDDAWSLLRWWLSTETQVRFAGRLQTTFGPQYLWNSANLAAFDQLPLPAEHRRVIAEQWRWTREVPRHPGGYMTEREISNAWSAVVMRGVGLREAVDRAVVTIDRELSRKLEEFGYLRGGERLRDYVIRPVGELLRGP